MNNYPLLKEKFLEARYTVFWVILTVVAIVIFLNLESKHQGGQVSGSVVEDPSYLQGREEYYSEEFWEEYYKY